MAKDTGKIKSSIKDIKEIECYYNFSVRGNATQLPCDEKGMGQMIDDYSIYLSDKEFLEKYSDKISSSFDDDDFEENGNVDEFRVTQEYYIVFNDGSEIAIDFDVPDFNFIGADSRDAEKGSMAEKYIREFEMDKWDTDIDSLFQEVNGNKIGKGGVVGKLNSLSLEELGELYVTYGLEDEGEFEKGKDVVVKKLLDNVDGKTIESDLRDIPSMGKGGLTRAKARQILHEGVAHGKNISNRQRRYFGAVASGSARKEKGGVAEKKKTLKKGDAVQIIGKRWFERTNGNTYHSVDVYANNEFVGREDFSYGYGDQYIHSGLIILKEHYNVPKGFEPERSPIYQLEELGIKILTSVSDVARKKDLEKGGVVESSSDGIDWLITGNLI